MPRVALGAVLAGNNRSKGGSQYLGIFCQRLLCPTQLQCIFFFPSLSVADDLSAKSFFPLPSTFHIPLHLGFVFPDPTCACLDGTSSQVACSYFFLLYAAFSCLVRSSCFMFPCLLPPLLAFLCVVMDHFLTWKRWFLKMLQLCWASLSLEWSPMAICREISVQGKLCSVGPGL